MATGNLVAVKAEIVRTLASDLVMSTSHAGRKSRYALPWRFFFFLARAAGTIAGIVRFARDRRIFVARVAARRRQC
jgi:hypothetical protein